MTSTFLITGGAGFIGSHLAQALVSQGHRVFVIDDLSTGRIDNIEHLLAHPNFRFQRACIADEAVLDGMTSQCDTVIHLAAAVGVKLVIDEPLRTLETNVDGTETVLRVAHRYMAKVLIASTSEVYGKSNAVPFREDDDIVLGPTSRSRWGYAASKLFDEFLALAYWHQRQLPVVVFRLFNTVGPRQSSRYGMVIPRLMRQALKGEPITVYGDGSQTRCFCDVNDVVRALVGLANSPDAVGQVFNIGSSEETSIVQLAERIRTIAESNSQIVFVPYSQAYGSGFEDMLRRVPNTRRIRSLLGWEPSLTLNETLLRVLDWQRSNIATLISTASPRCG